MNSESANSLIPWTTNQKPAVQTGFEYLETDIYKASRIISKMQKLNKNILSFWDDKLLDADDAYIEPPRIKSLPSKHAVKATKEQPKKKPSKPKESKVKNKYLGLTKMMNCGLSATVIEYLDCKNLTIRFEDGLIKRGVRSDHFMGGKVSHSE